MNIKNIKNKLPYPIMQGLRYAYGRVPFPIRHGKVFRDTYKFLQKSQWWSKEKLEAYQRQELKKLLEHAYENVPYYTRIFDERRLKPKDIKSVDDLKKLPYLTKEIIKRNSDDLISKKHSKSKLERVTTGGSTGVPLEFYWENGVTNSKEWAFVWRGWNWANFNFGEKKVILRGNVVNKLKNGKRQIGEYCPVDRALVLSSHDMTDENLVKYIKMIKKFKPAIIQAYPSSLYILICFLKSNNLRIEGIRAILTSSETLLPYQKAAIEECLGTKVFDHYGNSERNTLIMQCEKGKYHIIPEYGVTELIGKDGNSVSADGGRGEVIATGFNNYAMPFIRYKTKDVVVYREGKCACGKNCSMAEKIEGRLQDFIVTKNDSLIPLTAIKYEKIEEDNSIKQFQFFQDKPGEVILKIIKYPEYPERGKIDILRSLLEGIEVDINFSIVYVTDIPRTKNGKFRFLIQNVPIEFVGV